MSGLLKEEQAAARRRAEIALGWRARRHRDPYCVDHCRPGIKHSQCGCPCDHRASSPPERSVE